MATRKRGAQAKRRASQPLSEFREGPKARTTLLISTGLDRMVEVCAALERRQKSDIVNEALAEYLGKKEELRALSAAG